MKRRSKAGVCLVAAIIAVACGRVSEDEDGSSGGTGGTLGTGGSVATGGFGGTGAFGTGGKTTTGGTATGGTMGKGGAPATGGAPGTGGTIAKGGSTSTGGTIGWGGEGGVGGQAGEYVPLGRSSWDVAMQLSVTVGTPTFSCKNASFTLHVEPNGSLLDILSGRDGSVLPGKLAYSAGAIPRYISKDSLSLPTIGDCTVSNISVSELELRGWDDGFDGIADSLEGTGKASVTVIVGDVGATAQLSFRLTGLPDTHAPSLILPAANHPLNGVMLSASEPVALTSTVTLSNADGKVVLPGYAPEVGALGRFSSALVLPFGSTWNVEAAGRDLANLPFAKSSSQLSLLPDPGLFAQDGFETAPRVLLSGAAQVVTSVGNLPAIAGTRSLLIPPSSGATLHLARPAGISSVLFSMQSLSSSSGATVTAPSVEIGLVGSTERWTLPAAPSAAISMATGDSTWPYAGDKRDVSVPLSQTGTDAVIRIATTGCGGFCPPPQAILIDDLRVE